MSSHDATFYVRIRADRKPDWAGGGVAGLTAFSVTKSKPANLPTDTVAVKLTVRLPDAAVDALTPEAVVIVPAELVQRALEVEAEAGDASNGGV